MKKIISVVGARPNFIKIAPLHRAFQPYQEKIKHLICHTGQHFDEKMSEVFFKEFGLPKPDFNLGIGGGSHASQTARIMLAFEEILVAEKPDLVIVPGDVNSTMACSLVASKFGIPIAHVESGLRSFDRGMPEEVNRVVTDVLSDFLFVSEPSGLINLKNEGIADEKVFYVGNIMIDSLVDFLPKIEASQKVKELGMEKGEYVLVTFHRPSNVDSPEFLNELVDMLNDIAVRVPVVFPIHPRTRKHLESNGMLNKFSDNVKFTEPIGYIDFLALVKDARFIITDSGGIQEETTFLGVQCITVRDNTERPVTVELGTNQLIGTDLKDVKKAYDKLFAGELKEGRIPELWDGQTAMRIAGILSKRI